MRSEQALSVVEAAYRLEGDHQQWLEGIAEAARPLADEGLISIVAEYAPVPGSSSLVAHAVAPARQDLLRAFLDIDALGRADPQAAPTLHRTTVCQTTSEFRVEMELDALDTLYTSWLHPLGVRDSFNIQGADISGHALCIMGMRSQTGNVPPMMRSVWERVAVHLAAAQRLRRALGDPAPAAALDSARAIFDASVPYETPPLARRPSALARNVAAATASIRALRSPPFSSA